VTADSIRIERLDRARREELFRFFQRAYESGSAILSAANADRSRIAARWEWLNERYPVTLDDDRWAWVALRGDEIIGHIAALPVTAVARGGQEVPFVWARDLIVDPEARGLGAASRLVRELVETAGRVLLGGLNPEVRRLYRRLGYRDWGAVPFFVRPVDARAFASLTRWPSAVLGFSAVVLRTLTAIVRPPGGSGGVEVGDLGAYDAEFDRLWRRIEPALAPVIRRSSATMRWRYADHPEHRYRSLAARIRGDLRGVAILRSGRSRGLLAGHIVELLADPADVDVVDTLIASATEILVADRSAFLRATNGCRPIGRRLLRAGFIPAPSPTRMMFARGARVTADPIERQTWSINGGDSDFDAL
jgi:GNAT superfamily N-acetyltransferase